MDIEIELFDDDEGCYLPVKLPARYEVCDRCEGHGTECTLGAMTGDEYRELLDGDPDFPEDYKRGVYDRACSACEGKRVVAVVDDDALSPDMRKKVEQHYHDLAEDAAARRQQERFGY